MAFSCVHRTESDHTQPPTSAHKHNNKTACAHGFCTAMPLPFRHLHSEFIPTITDPLDPSRPLPANTATPLHPPTPCNSPLADPPARSPTSAQIMAQPKATPSLQPQRDKDYSQQYGCRASFPPVAALHLLRYMHRSFAKMRLRPRVLDRVGPMPWSDPVFHETLPKVPYVKCILCR